MELGRQGMRNRNSEQVERSYEHKGLSPVTSEENCGEKYFLLLARAGSRPT